MSAGQDEGPDERYNRLRHRLREAETTASVSLSELGASSGNPLEGVVSVIEDSWTATGSPTRANFVEDVRGAGQGVRDAFTAARDDIGAQADAEDVWIDVNARPDEEWKTSGTRIDSRAYAPYARGY